MTRPLIRVRKFNKPPHCFVVIYRYFYDENCRFRAGPFNDEDDAYQCADQLSAHPVVLDAAVYIQRHQALATFENGIIKQGSREQAA